MSIFLLVLALGVVKLPESSTVEFRQTSSGLGGSETEEFTITQTGRSVNIKYDRWRDSWGRGTDTAKTHLVSTIPLDAYQDLWDSLAARRFFGLDSGYSSKMIVYDAYRDGYIAAEYSRDGQRGSKKVCFSGLAYDEPFQRVYDAVSKMALWATASVEQVRAGKITFALPRWTPRMLKYIRESGDAPEMTKYILALVDSTTTHKSSEWRWIAKGGLLGLAESSIGALDSALLHQNPQVRLLALTVVTDTLGDSAVPLARRALGDAFGEVRYKAAIFLARRGSADAMPVLYKSLHDSTFTQAASARVLLELATLEAFETLFAWAQQARSQEVGHVFEWPGLGDVADERVSPVLRRLFAETHTQIGDIGKRPSDSTLFDTVADYVTDHPGEGSVDALLRLSKYRDALPATRAAFAKWPGNADLMTGLGALRDSTYFDTFVNYAENGSAWQKNHAVRALAHFNSGLGRSLKLQVLLSDSVDAYGIMAFITQPDPRAYNRLVALLQDGKTTPAMTSWICRALGALGDRRAIPYVAKAFEESSEWGRTHYIGPALESLRRTAKR